MNKKVVRNLWLFISIVIISGWLGVLVDSVLTEQPEGDSLGMGIWLVLPLMTAHRRLCVDRMAYSILFGFFA